jgi:hypothetical protein
VLFNYLTAQDALDSFLRAHPDVTHEAALAVLDRACRAITGQSTQGVTTELPPSAAALRLGVLVDEDLDPALASALATRSARRPTPADVVHANRLGNAR